MGVICAYLLGERNDAINAGDRPACVRAPITRRHSCERRRDRKPEVEAARIAGLPRRNFERPYQPHDDAQ